VSSARGLAAAVTLLCVSSLSAQAPAVPGPLPPLPDGYSVIRVEAARVKRFTVDERAWVPALHADVAIQRVRFGASFVRYPALNDITESSFGGGLSFTQVLVDQPSPAKLLWLSVGLGTAKLGAEQIVGSRAWEAVVSLGGAKRYAPPSIGEVLVTVAPRAVFRRIESVPLDMDEDAVGAGATVGLDWGSQARLGALLAADLDWLSSRPAPAKKLQLGFRAGVSYRFMLFPRAHPMPPPEE
jgi:hypothetical protein